MNKLIKIIVKKIYYFPSNLINKIQYRLKNISYGKMHETKGIIYIKSKGLIHIGDNVRINSKGTANPIGVGARTYFQLLPGAELIIGDNTRMSNCAVTVASKVTIGKNVRIGSGVKIYDTDFHCIDPNERLKYPEGMPEAKPVVIEDAAFIGAGAYILKGVTIGRYAVVGAAAVVTKDIPEGEIWAGNPAKKVGIIAERS